jgi:hypothetical protein
MILEFLNELHHQGSLSSGEVSLLLDLSQYWDISVPRLMRLFNFMTWKDLATSMAHFSNAYILDIKLAQEWQTTPRLSKGLAEYFSVIPLYESDIHYGVIFENPLDKNAIQALTFLLDKQIILYVATEMTYMGKSYECAYHEPMPNHFLNKPQEDVIRGIFKSTHRSPLQDLPQLSSEELSTLHQKVLKSLWTQNTDKSLFEPLSFEIQKVPQGFKMTWKNKNYSIPKDYDKNHPLIQTLLPLLRYWEIQDEENKVA